MLYIFVITYEDINFILRNLKLENFFRMPLFIVKSYTKPNKENAFKIFQKQFSE